MKRIGLGKILLAGLTSLLGASMIVPGHAANTINLLAANYSFEQSRLPANVVAAAFNQPVLPVGWIFEGATELFDHTPNAHKNGQYSVAISGSWSGPRSVCEPTCMALPGGQQRDMIPQYYSPAPSWRNDTPVPAAPGMYTLSVWTRYVIPKTNTGAITKIRWLNSAGVPIGISNGPSRIFTEPGANYTNFIKDADGTPPKEFNETSDTGWVRIYSDNIVAPAGTASAVVLLGYTDDAWNGSVGYDVVCFTKQVTGQTNVCHTAQYATPAA